MQVANNEALLKKHLQERYEQAIQEIDRQARTEAEVLAKEYAAQARREETSILTTSKEQASQEAKKALATAQATAQKEVTKAISELVAEVLTQEENKIREQDKKKTLQWLEETVQQAVKKQQLTNIEYTRDEKQLLVQASNQELVIEYSLKEHLREQEQQAIKRVQEEVKKCLKH